MSLDQARAKLAKAQLALVQALTRQTSAPDDFDVSRLQVAADALIQKRVRHVDRAWPSLRRAFGPRFLDRFAEFAVTAAIPRRGGPVADGRAFVRYLDGRGELPEEARLEALVVDLRYAAVQDGLVPRRLPTFRIGWFPKQFGTVLAVRVPWLGEYWWFTGYSLTFRQVVPVKGGSPKQSPIGHEKPHAGCMGQSSIGRRTCSGARAAPGSWSTITPTWRRHCGATGRTPPSVERCASP